MLEIHKSPCEIGQIGKSNTNSLLSLPAAKFSWRSFNLPVLDSEKSLKIMGQLI